MSNISVNPVSDEDDNKQGDTNNQTQAGSETPEDSGGSVETSTESGVDEKTTESAEVVERKKRKVAITSRPWSSGNRKKEVQPRQADARIFLETSL